MNALTNKLSEVLREAPESELINILEDLVTRGADINDQSDIVGWSALHYAASFGKSAAVDWLLANGANIDARSEERRTPLCEAAHNGHASVVEKLIIKGADISVRNEWGGLAALTDAAFYGHPEVIRVLLANGNDVNDQNKSGATALYYAAGHGEKKAVKFLLSHGANVELKFEDGTTPLDNAREGGHLEIVKILLAAQESLSNTNRPERTSRPQEQPVSSAPPVVQSGGLLHRILRFFSSASSAQPVVQASPASSAPFANTKAQEVIDGIYKSFGKDVSFTVVFDYAAHQSNTGHQDVAAELFKRVYEGVKQLGGSEETKLLSAFAHTLCATRAAREWPVSRAYFPPEIADRFAEAQNRFVAMTIVAHSNRKGIASVAGGNTSGFQLRIRGDSHSLNVQDDGGRPEVVISPPTSDSQMLSLVEEARQFQVTIPCMFMISGSQSWW